MMFSRQGSVLSWVLLMFLLMMTLILMVASSSGLYWRSANLMVRDSLAENLGESLVAEAIANLNQSSSYGKNRETLKLSLDPEGEPGVFGNLTFGDQPGDSINNIDGSYTGRGYGDQLLPLGTVQLIANISARGHVYHEVVVVSKAPYPYVVSTSGSFASSGSLLLGNLRSLSDLSDGLQENDLLKGQLLANGSLSVAPPAKVAGDLKTAGSASVEGVIFLTGGVKDHVKPEDIPHLDLREYDPAGKPEIVEYRASEIGSNPLTVAGLMRVSGTATLSKKLTLNSGVLFVDGDLRLDQGVEGYGAVFCTGSLFVTGGSDLGSDSLCALVAGKDLSIAGAGANNTQFRGLVYSGGESKVSNITVVGSLVGSSSAGAPMSIENAHLVYDPKAVDLSLDLQFSGFGKVSLLNGGVQLASDSKLTPSLLFEGGKFREPTLGELQQGLLFTLPGKPARRWDELTAAEQGADALKALLKRGNDIVAAQIQKWNQDNLNPQTLSANYHLDLNRFVKVQSAMKILTRRLYRN